MTFLDIFCHWDSDCRLVVVEQNLLEVEDQKVLVLVYPHPPQKKKNQTKQFVIFLWFAFSSDKLAVNLKEHNKRNQRTYLLFASELEGKRETDLTCT